MPAVSNLDKLPLDVRAWLDEALSSHSFSGYEELAEELTKLGFQVSRSAVHRYGKVLKEKLAHTASSETARALCIVAAAIKGAEDVEATAQRYLSWVRHGN